MGNKSSTSSSHGAGHSQASTSSSSSTKRVTPLKGPQVTDSNTSKLAKANNAFGLELFVNTCAHDAQLDAGERTGKGNVVVSPLSIGAALTMTSLGCSNEALDAVRKVLRLDQVGTEEQLKQAWR